jgi:hypothetical protein
MVPLVAALQRTVFAVERRPYSWGDVVLAAEAWGDWAASEQAARAAAAGLARARQAREPLAGGEIDRAEEAWRRARRLLAAEELQAWLADRVVGVEEWRDYIRGLVLAGRAEATADGEPIDDHGVWVHATCSGALVRVARKLAERVAVASLVAAGPLTVDLLERLDREFEEFCAAAATPAAIEREIDRRRLDWLLVDWRFQASEDQAMMREAALCVRDDGLDFADVARTAGLAVERRLDTVEEIPPELQAHLLGAAVGSVVGPVSAAGTFLVAEVMERRPPTVDDPDVADRARQSVLARAVGAELTDRVSWHERL